MGEPIRQHHGLAMGKTSGNVTHAEFSGGGSGTGGTNKISNDAHVGQAGEGHVHTTDPAKDGGHQHGDHEHHHMHHHHPKHHHGGHVHMHEHHPEHHDGGHGDHKHHGRGRKNY